MKDPARRRLCGIAFALGLLLAATPASATLPTDCPLARTVSACQQDACAVNHAEYAPQMYRSSVRIEVSHVDGSRSQCSGNLINNGFCADSPGEGNAYCGRPYVATAWHCFSEDALLTTEEKNATVTAFMGEYSKSDVCAEIDQTASYGATLVAGDPNADIMIVELDRRIEDWRRPLFLGIDARPPIQSFPGIGATFAVGYPCGGGINAQAAIIASPDRVVDSLIFYPSEENPKYAQMDFYDAGGNIQGMSGAQLSRELRRDVHALASFSRYGGLDLELSCSGAAPAEDKAGLWYYFHTRDAYGPPQQVEVGLGYNQIFTPDKEAVVPSYHPGDIGDPFDDSPIPPSGDENCWQGFGTSREFDKMRCGHTKYVLEAPGIILLNDGFRARAGVEMRIGIDESRAPLSCARGAGGYYGGWCGDGDGPWPRYECVTKCYGDI